MTNSNSRRIGRVAALISAIATTLFAVSLVWEAINLSPIAINLGYVSCLILPIAVVIMMASFYVNIEGQFKIYGLIALIFSVLYAPFCITTYYLQLSIVNSNTLELTDEVLKAIIFKPGSPTFAIDMLGYFFLCLSTLAAGFALTQPQYKILRIFCFFHGGLVIPTLIGPIISHLYLSESGETDLTGYFVLIFWCAVFAPIPVLLMRYFKDEHIANQVIN